MFCVPWSSSERSRIEPMRKPLSMKKRSMPKKIQYDSRMNLGSR